MRHRSSLRHHAGLSGGLSIERSSDDPIAPGRARESGRLRLVLRLRRIKADRLVVHRDRFRIPSLAAVDLPHMGQHAGIAGADLAGPLERLFGGGEIAGVLVEPRQFELRLGRVRLAAGPGRRGAAWRRPSGPDPASGWRGRGRRAGASGRRQSPRRYACSAAGRSPLLVHGGGEVEGVVRACSDSRRSPARSHGGRLRSSPA